MFLKFMSSLILTLHLVQSLLISPLNHDWVLSKIFNVYMAWAPAHHIRCRPYIRLADQHPCPYDSHYSQPSPPHPTPTPGKQVGSSPSLLMSLAPHCLLEKAQLPWLGPSPFSHCHNLLRATYCQQSGYSRLPRPQTCLPCALSTIVEGPSHAHLSPSSYKNH